MLKKSKHILLPALLFLSCQQVNAAEAIYRDTAFRQRNRGACITFPFKPVFADVTVHVIAYEGANTVEYAPPLPPAPYGDRYITSTENDASYYYIRASKSQVCYTLSGQKPAGDVIARDLASTQVMVVARARSFDGLYDDAKYMEYRQGKNKD
jgi:hypothetical protein